MVYWEVHVYLASYLATLGCPHMMIHTVTSDSSLSLHFIALHCTSLHFIDILFLYVLLRYCFSLVSFADVEAAKAVVQLLDQHQCRGEKYCCDGLLHVRHTK